MDFFSNILSFFKKKNIEKEPLQNLKPLPPPPTITGDLQKILIDSLKISELNEGFLFFDPEEKFCFVYKILKNDRIQKFEKISASNWSNFFRQLKNVNNKYILLKNNTYFAVISIFFTNFDERVALKFFIDKEPDIDILKQERKQIIHQINLLKPPTALTQENIENLFKLINNQQGKNKDDLLNLLVKEEILNKEKINKFSKYSISKILAMPVPRKGLVRAVAQWLNVKYFDVELNEVNREKSLLVPKEITKKAKAIAFGEKDGKIKVAFANPFNGENISLIKETLKKDIIIYMSCEEDIRNEIEKIYCK